MELDAGKVQQWATRRGYAAALGCPAVVEAVRAEVETRLAHGELDRRFYRTSLAAFRYLTGLESAEKGTLIVLAVPRPAHRLSFQLPPGWQPDARSGGSAAPAGQSGLFQVLVPPTYRGYGALPHALRDEMLTGSAGGDGPLPTGARLFPLYAPLKNVAARLGLVTYGRNNVTYLPGRGSYHQLVGFLTDAELADYPLPGSPAPSPDCEGCRACAQACPTGAIASDRFLLRAERCLTFLNEGAGRFPDWVPSSAHNCLVGCLVCQKVCPQNKGRLAVVDLEPAFTEEETAVVLAAARAGSNARSGRVWREVKARLAAWGLPGYEGNLARNLLACLEGRPWCRPLRRAEDVEPGEADGLVPPP